jgi:hypothetical protein
MRQRCRSCWYVVTNPNPGLRLYSPNLCEHVHQMLLVDSTYKGNCYLASGTKLAPSCGLGPAVEPLAGHDNADTSRRVLHPSISPSLVLSALQDGMDIYTIIFAALAVRPAPAQCPWTAHPFRPLTVAALAFAVLAWHVVPNYVSSPAFGDPQSLVRLACDTHLIAPARPAFAAAPTQRHAEGGGGS